MTDPREYSTPVPSAELAAHTAGWHTTATACLAAGDAAGACAACQAASADGVSGPELDTLWSRAFDALVLELAPPTHPARNVVDAASDAPVDLADTTETTETLDDAAQSADAPAAWEEPAEPAAMNPWEAAEAAVNAGDLAQGVALYSTLVQDEPENDLARERLEELRAALHATDAMVSAAPATEPADLDAHAPGVAAAIGGAMTAAIAAGQLDGPDADAQEAVADPEGMLETGTLEAGAPETDAVDASALEAGAPTALALAETAADDETPPLEGQGLAADPLADDIGLAALGGAVPADAVAADALAADAVSVDPLAIQPVMQADAVDTAQDTQGGADAVPTLDLLGADDFGDTLGDDAFTFEATPVDTEAGPDAGLPDPAALALAADVAMLEQLHDRVRRRRRAPSRLLG